MNDNEIDAMHLCVEYAVEKEVRKFAQRCISHPRLEEDPIPVIANEREKYLDNLKTELSWLKEEPERLVMPHAICKQKKGRIL